MESYARRHAPQAPAPQAPHARDPRPISDGSGAFDQVERLEMQVQRLGSQVVEAVRALGLVQELVSAVDSRVASLELRQPSLQAGPTKAVASCSSASPPGVASHQASAQPCAGGMARSASLRGLEDCIRGRLRDLRGRQEDVEDLVRQVVAEAQASSMGPDGGDIGRSSFDTGGYASPRSDAGISPHATPAASFSPDWRWEADQSRSRVPDVAHRTEGTIQQLEADLGRLRGELASASAAHVSRAAAKPSAGHYEDAGRQPWEAPPSNRTPSVSRLYDELVRLEEQSKHWQAAAHGLRGSGAASSIPAHGAKGGGGGGSRSGGLNSARRRALSATGLPGATAGRAARRQRSTA